MKKILALIFLLIQVIVKVIICDDCFVPNCEGCDALNSSFCLFCKEGSGTIPDFEGRCVVKYGKLEYCMNAINEIDCYTCDNTHVININKGCSSFDDPSLLSNCEEAISDNICNKCKDGKVSINGVCKDNPSLKNCRIADADSGPCKECFSNAHWTIDHTTCTTVNNCQSGLNGECNECKKYFIPKKNGGVIEECKEREEGGSLEGCKEFENDGTKDKCTSCLEGYRPVEPERERCELEDSYTMRVTFYFD